MKSLKKLNMKHKKFLVKEGLKPEDFMLERDTSEEFVFYNKHTGVLWKFWK